MGKILLVEDDLFFQKFYTSKLIESGYEVVSAVNGKEALSKLGNESFKLVLLDLVMPEVDGFEVLRQRSLNDRWKSIPVIVFSTLGQDEDINRAKSLGANDYMNKTFYNINDLLNKIKALLAISSG